MEYQWHHHHHPPPPLHPPPRQPPPPPPVGDLFPNSHPPHFQYPIPQSHLQNPNFHSHNPQLPDHNPNFQSHYQNPNSQLPHHNPNFHPHNNHPDPQLHDHNPSFHSHYQNPNSQLPNHNPSFHPHNNHPDPQLPNHNPSFHPHNNHPDPQLPNHNPSFHPHNKNPNSQLHDHSPNFHSQFHNPNSQLHDHSPNFRLHDHNPNSHFTDQNPNFRLSDQSPNFQSHDHTPNFRLPDQNHNFQLHDHNPNFRLPDQNPKFQSHDQNTSYQPHEQRPILQMHCTNPSFLSHDQSPNFQMHNQSPSFPSHDQSPNFQSQHQNPIFRPHEPIPSFISHGQNPSFQPHEQNHSYSLQDRSPSFPSHEQRSNLQNHRIAQNRDLGIDYSPFDHGCKRPRPDESGVGDNNRMLKLVHEHGLNESMLINGDSRVQFHENSGLKRPRFDELGVGQKYPATNLNSRYEINEHRGAGFNGFHAENEINRRPLLHTNIRDEYEPKQIRNEFDRHSYDMKSNTPPCYDSRSRSSDLNDSVIGNYALPTSLRVSPRNNLSLENSHAAPPTSLFFDPKEPCFLDKLATSSQPKASSLFPISGSSASPIATPYSPFSDPQNSGQTHLKDQSHVHASNGYPAKEFQSLNQRLSMNYPRERQHFPLVPLNKPASHIFKQPHRASRPDHIVVILRGLPGSGKSYLAKMMKDLEVENGGNAPRIHTMDDYFMTEVEKVEESDNPKSSGSSRGKKPVVKMVMEYCYEAEMEEAYRSSMLKTFKKTLDEGAFPFVIVDDRNLRVADFAQFWATAKRSGYEVYLLEATYKDPAGCAARNVHGFTLDDIQKMANHWEEAPSMYLKLDAKSLLQGGDSKENEIQEVDMDTDDGESEDALHGSAERNGNISAPGPAKADDSLNAERSHLKEEVKELGRSKWSNDVEDDDVENKEGNKGNSNALSAIFKAYKKDGKSVHWGDQAANTGFSIGAANRAKPSLQIGPGSGYNSKSNPLTGDLVSPRNSGKSKTQSVFQERIQAEHDSFRAVFDRRRHQIDGLGSDEE